MNILQFDEMEVNTDLAKEYFKENEHRFSHKSIENKNKSANDGYGNTICYDDHRDIPFILNQGGIIQDVTPFEVEDKLKKLAEAIEKNSELFCQIEYLVRKIPVNEVRNFDIKLMVQNLSCSDNQTSISRFLILEMDDNTPLAHLGYLAQMVRGFAKHNILIVATKNTAAVAHLFTELCHSVRLDLVKTFFVEEPLKMGISMDILSAFYSGCVGVVSERSDVDSAIDTLLETTTRYPWKLSRILVEESVFSSFSQAIAWKADLKPEQLPESLQAAAASSAKAFAYGGKTFLINYAGNADSTCGAILVEAYRTTKELISLLKKHHSLCLSLWASDIAQANEIAHNAASSIVWINDYGVFDGPPQASRAIFTEITWSNTKRIFGCITDTTMLQRQEAWAKKSFEERAEIVLNAVDEFYDEEIESQTSKMDFLRDLRIALRKIKSENFVSIENTRMCVCLSVPVQYSFVNTLDTEDIEQLARALTNGSTIKLQKEFGGLKHGISGVYLNEKSTMIPIVWYGKNLDSWTWKCDGNNDYYFNWKYSLFERTKVIWTNFGTVFAN